MMLVRQIAAFNSCGTRWGCVIHQILKFRSANSVGAKNKTSCARSNLKLRNWAPEPPEPESPSHFPCEPDCLTSRLTPTSAAGCLTKQQTPLWFTNSKGWKKEFMMWLFIQRFENISCFSHGMQIEAMCQLSLYDWSRFVKWLQLVTTEPYKLGTLNTHTLEHTSKSSTFFDR